ncbi:hypothetical protein A0H81_03495 [Grifola frondosa]|uniref:Uncharacterized protein n=1 Tax=Grifola frondosa TaxID=5627 RepID=A0A1C7MI75_GRIFR|nr:hypothetical protein A0H81_03495 [Grifola frondosa]
MSAWLKGFSAVIAGMISGSDQPSSHKDLVASGLRRLTGRRSESDVLEDISGLYAWVGYGDRLRGGLALPQEAT